MPCLAQPIRCRSVVPCVITAAYRCTTYTFGSRPLALLARVASLFCPASLSLPVGSYLSVAGEDIAWVSTVAIEHMRQRHNTAQPR